MHIEMSVGKNAKGYFFSYNGKIILESLSLNELLALIPHLEESGVTIVGTGLDRSLPKNMLHNLSSGEVSQFDS
jgi:hypothetical protein